MMFKQYLYKQTSIAPLAVFRIAFGLMMFGSTLRFMLKGWVGELYIKPTFHFTYFGFDWVKPLGEFGMYMVFVGMLVCSLFIAIGLLYRYSAVLFFLLFTYVELLDKTNYLNHYYFVSLISFLMIFLPANRYFSLDVKLNPSRQLSHVNNWCIDVIKLQLGIVYFFAGVAKLNYDWLINAMPLRIWLPANYDLPIIGPFMDETWVAYLFSWFGAVYDLAIPFLLLSKRTRSFAYLAVIVFHVVTSALFPIGVFPFVMIVSTLIFFSPALHERIINVLSKTKNIVAIPTVSTKTLYSKPLLALLTIFFVIQLLLPFHYLLYPGKLFWTEQGFRFSWRVMLMEKAGTAFFTVKDATSGRSCEVMNQDFLTKQQEKMMSTQPDMILQYAHYLKEVYSKKGMVNPKVFVQSFVTLNGSGSRLFIDPTVNLASVPMNLSHKWWVLPFKNNVRDVVAK